MGDFAGKAGLVTGAGSGIGRASALGFAARGAAVGVIDIDGDAARETAAAIEAAGGNALPIEADVTDEQGVSAAVERLVKSFGRLDFAHNNAGARGVIAPLADMTSEDFDRVVTINLKGCFLCMKYELPHMVAGGGGAIVNTASTAGVVAVAQAPQYVASKHGVVGLSKAAAMDYGSFGIRVVALCPGKTATPMYAASVRDSPPGREAEGGSTWLGRVADPSEVAAAAVWLASDEASFVTGGMFAVNGGRLGF